MSLTFDKTRGTKTYHLPFERTGSAPRMTVVLERLEDGRLAAGVSVCSQADQFIKASGRARAFYRLKGKPIVAHTGSELFLAIQEHLADLHEQTNPLNDNAVSENLFDVCGNIDQTLDTLAKNRQAMAASEITAAGQISDCCSFGSCTSDLALDIPDA